jgi:hypothetical protein
VVLRCFAYEFQVFRSITLWANREHDAPTAVAVGEADRSVEVDLFSAATFVEMDEPGLTAKSVEKIFDLCDQRAPKGKRASTPPFSL